MIRVCESLETRRLLAATLGGDGTLTITGTAGADSIGVRVVDTTLRVDINGTLSKFAAAAVTFITVDLLDGADVFAAGVATNIYVLGGLGDDTITTSLGNDTITSGGGRDLIDGGWGDDRLNGGPTADKVFGNDGADRLYGGDANDYIEGGAGVDRIFADSGNDYLVGGSSNDKIYGDTGDDTIFGNNQNDLLSGGDGDDEIHGGDGADTLNGQVGNDDLFGDKGSDTAFGDEGLNVISGGNDADLLTGGDNTDTLRGGEGNDTLRGQGAGDRLDGEGGSDRLEGGSGDDRLSGGVGPDVLFGGGGSDGLLGGADEDQLNGNHGADRFLIRPGDGAADFTSIDAKLIFLDDDKTWTEDEIFLMDDGLRMIEQRTGNTKLLKLPGGGEVTIERVVELPSDDPDTITLATNLDGLISVADAAFDDEDDATATMIHELGHNWDSEAENPTARDFFELSKWREVRGDPPSWTNDPKAVFASDYADTDPNEDFAESLAVYFSKTRPASQWQVKWNYIDGFLDSMSG